MEGPLTPVLAGATNGRSWSGGTTVDVLVVGAGPAGATAALVLARAGVDVALLDRAPLPRDKTCGGGVVARALEALPHGVAIPVERRLGKVESRFVAAGLAVTVERETPLVHMAMRAPLDLVLAEAAGAAGAALRTPCAIERVGLAADHVAVETNRGSLRARFLVAADGATGPTARASGWTQPLASVPALEAEVEVPSSSWIATPTAPGSISGSRPEATDGSSPRPRTSRWASVSSREARSGGAFVTSSRAISTPSVSVRRACCASGERPFQSGLGATPRAAESSSRATPPASRIRLRARGSPSRS